MYHDVIHHMKVNWYEIRFRIVYVLCFCSDLTVSFIYLSMHFVQLPVSLLIRKMFLAFSSFMAVDETNSFMGAGCAVNALGLNLETLPFCTYISDSLLHYRLLVF